ncbi:sugar phosphate isomerase/epimerase [Sporichthya brevicatena]|uniref:Sugar phosphate isomerase/epimerase n=1 Tax=Sporichthya brevicatena TaxID=171442 RepID=A0ABP3SGE4_9ACTN
MTAPWIHRLAGAPISWGVCEVPGWGYQLPADLVLSEMAAAGLRAAEFGPDGFLPDGGSERAAVLHRFGMSAVGGFVPVVVHAGEVEATDFDPLFGAFKEAGAGVVVFAAVSGQDGYDSRPELGDDEWTLLCMNLDRLAERAAAFGLVGTLHPHVGTLVERPQEIDRVLLGATIGLCLDTGHCLAGGGDPLALAKVATRRIRHVHLKDVDAALAARVRTGELTYTEAVAAGMYRPLGAGDARVADIVATLEAAGYDGWYVLEQDRILPAPRGGEDDPTDANQRAAAAIRADVDASLAHLRAALPV